jgi:hypothetical protein
MSRTGSTKRVDAAYALGRLRKALAFHDVATLAAVHLDSSFDADAITTNVVLAMIAYTDAITAAYSGQVNQKDHQAAVKLLRDTLGKSLPDAQERRLNRMLGRKEEMSYGARLGRQADIQQAIDNLEEFAAWAKATLAAREISIDA